MSVTCKLCNRRFADRKKYMHHQWNDHSARWKATGKQLRTPEVEKKRLAGLRLYFRKKKLAEQVTAQAAGIREQSLQSRAVRSGRGHKRRGFTAEQKAEILRGFDALPEGRTGERGDYVHKHRLNWRMMHGWRQDRKVQAVMRNQQKLLPAPKTAQAEVVGPIDIPKMVPDRKRNLTLRQKAQLISGYDALTVGSFERAEFLRKYRVYGGMLNRWRVQLEMEGIPVPEVKKQAVPEVVEMVNPNGLPRRLIKAPGEDTYYEDAPQRKARDPQRITIAEALQVLTLKRQHVRERLHDQEHLLDEVLEIMRRVEED